LVENLHLVVHAVDVEGAVVVVIVVVVVGWEVLLLLYCHFFFFVFFYPSCFVFATGDFVGFAFLTARRCSCSRCCVKYCFEADARSDFGCVRGRGGDGGLDLL
jgi:hypothetical protein